MTVPLQGPGAAPVTAKPECAPAPAPESEAQVKITLPSIQAGHMSPTNPFAMWVDSLPSTDEDKIRAPAVTEIEPSRPSAQMPQQREEDPQRQLKSAEVDAGCRPQRQHRRREIWNKILTRSIGAMHVRDTTPAILPAMRYSCTGPVAQERAPVRCVRTGSRTVNMSCACTSEAPSCTWPYPVRRPWECPSPPSSALLCSPPRRRVSALHAPRLEVLDRLQEMRQRNRERQKDAPTSSRVLRRTAL